MAVNVKINGVTYRATDDYSIKQQGGAISTTQLRVLLGLNPVPSILQQVQIYMDATLFFTGLIQRVSSPEYSSAYEANVFSIDVSSLECLFNHRLVTKNFYDYTYTSWTQVIQYLFDNYITEENITMGEISAISTTFDSKYSVKDKKLTDVLNEIADRIGTASWWIDPATRKFYFRVATDFDIVTPPEHVREFTLVDEIGDIRTVEKVTGASAGVVGSASNGSLITTIAARTGGSGKIEYAESDNDIHSDTKAAAEAGYRLNLHDETQKTIECTCEDIAASAVYLSWPLDITINGVAIEGDFVVVERTIKARGPDLFSIRVTLKNNNYFARYGYSLKRVATIANNSVALLSDIAADSKLTPGEKITELARWNAELAAKAAYDAEADAYGVSRVAYDAAFTALSTYLNDGTAWTSGTPAWFDGEAFTETTDIVGADYDDNWQVLLDAKRSLEINTRLAIQEAADDAIAAAHKASIRLKVSDQRIIRARNGDLTPASIVLTSWYSDNGTAYAGRLQVELSVNGTDFVVAYQSSANEATHSYKVPVIYSSAFVILLRCRLYEAGGFTNILWETSAAINADPSAAAIYWGALTSAPTGDIQTNDYYFDSNTVASGGGKLRYWTGSAWAEMTSAHPLYPNAVKTAITDIMIWATAQGETVAAANAVFNSIVASQAFIDQLSATVLNAAIALINDYLTIGEHGYVAGPDADVDLDDGELRTFITKEGVYNQVFNGALNAWRNNISMRAVEAGTGKSFELALGADEASKVAYDSDTETAKLINFSQKYTTKGSWTYSATLGAQVNSGLSGTTSSIAVADIDETYALVVYYDGQLAADRYVYYNKTARTFGTPATIPGLSGAPYLRAVKMTDGNVAVFHRTGVVIFDCASATWGTPLSLTSVIGTDTIRDVKLNTDGYYEVVLMSSAYAIKYCLLTPAFALSGSITTVYALGYDTTPTIVAKSNGDLVIYYSTKLAGTYHHIYRLKRTSGTWTASPTDLYTTDATAGGSVSTVLLPDGTTCLFFKMYVSWYKCILTTADAWGTPAKVGDVYYISVANAVELSTSGKLVYLWASNSGSDRIQLNNDSSYFGTLVDGTAFAPFDDYLLEEKSGGLQVLTTPFQGFQIGAGIIESGSNANGYYRKFSDGTLEQWGTAGYAIGSILNSNIGTYGFSLYYGEATVTYPTEFFAAPIVTVTAGAYGISSTAYTIGKATFVTATYSNGTATAQQNIVCWRAIGRWK